MNRYDGYTFKHFDKQNSGLRANEYITSIVEDKDENLWLEITEFQGLGEKSICDIFNPKTGKAIPLEKYFSDGLPFSPDDFHNVRYHEPQDLIWLSTRKGELFFYKNREFIKIAERLPIMVNNLVIDDESNIWVAGTNQLLCLDQKGQILESIPFPKGFHPINFGLGINSQIWTTLFPGKVFFPKKDDYTSLIFFKEKHKSNLELFKLTKNSKVIENFQNAVKTKKGFWYVTINQRLNVFDTKGKWIFDFNSLLGSGSELELNHFLESEEDVWFATPGGFLKTRIKESFFQTILASDKLTDSRGITEDDSGNIYFLSNTSLYRRNPTTSDFHRFSNFQGTLSLLYHNDNIYTGEYNNSNLINQLDLTTNEMLKYPTSHAQHVYSFMASDMPQKYLVGHNGGISYLDIQQQTILPFEKYNDFENLKDLLVYYLHKNKSGIWLATDGGIFLMTEQQGILQHFDQSSGHLPYDHIRHIYEDESGIFWLATAGGGLVQWKPVLNSDIPSTGNQWTTKDGLSHNHLYAVYGDDLGYLWIPSDMGLMQLKKSTLEVHTYTTSDGLPHNEFNLTSHYQAKDGTLYFGGLGGFIYFNPKDILRDSIYNVPMEFVSYHLLKAEDAEPTDLTNLLTNTDEIVISPSDKLFELSFVLLDFAPPENHLYAYQIEGYLDNWRTIEENHVRITNLPYGNYTLKIKGQNIKKGWSNQELALKVRVLKPFYLQWWFILSLLTISVGLIMVFIKRREANLKKDRERLEAEVKKRTQKIEEDKAIIEVQSKKLKQLDKAKTRFFSNVTHEFRTPLTLIIGPLEQVIENQPPPTIFKRRLNGVLNNAKHLLTLINQMLDLSKIESGSMKTEVIKGDIINYTREFVKRFEPFIEEKGHRFKFVSNQKSWETHFDKDKWDKIIYNLLSNALKFTPKGEVVQLSLIKTVFKEKEAIRLDVKDTGVGIKKEQLDQIFNRFYQVDDSSKREQDGTGIGLALVKELVELQGGEISVSSRVNKGTSFEIYLPVLDYEKEIVGQTLELPALPILNETTEKTAKQSPVPALTKNGKLELLIIEDNEEIREYIQYCLDTSKYNITESVNGEDGVLKAQSIIPDLIISDVMMPRKNGFEVVKEVRSNLATSHIPIILLTAKASLESRLEGLKRGADAYLTKPFSPQELALRIQKLIELRQLIQQRYQNNIQPKGEETYQKEDKFITQLKEHILENIDQSNLGGDEIGHQFGMSRVHLYRKLKALTNQSITEFVKQIRLGKAKELILEGELNISEITYQTGFSSISYFSRTFKKAYGVAPSEM